MNKFIPNESGWLLDEYDAESFWSLVDFEGGVQHLNDPLVDHEKVDGQCWVWTGTNDGKPSGGTYGRFLRYGKYEPAHRVAYRDFGMELPDSQVIDHLCRNTICVNPHHLEAVAHAENVRRGRQSLFNRGECNHGHKITPDNITERRRGGKIVYACKTCLAESARRTYLRRKERQKLTKA